MLFGGSAFLRRPRPVKPSRCGILFNTAPLLFLFNWLHGIINLKKCQCFPAIFMQSFQPQPARAFDFSSSSQDKTARAGDWHGRLRAQRGDSPSAHFIRGRGKPRDEQKNRWKTGGRKQKSETAQRFGTSGRFPVPAENAAGTGVSDLFRINGLHSDRLAGHRTPFRLWNQQSIQLWFHYTTSGNICKSPPLSFLKIHI